MEIHHCEKCKAEVMELFSAPVGSLLLCRRCYSEEEEIQEARDRVVKMEVMAGGGDRTTYPENQGRLD